MLKFMLDTNICSGLVDNPDLRLVILIPHTPRPYLLIPHTPAR